MASPRSPQVAPSRLLMCHLCGREFGTNSLHRHHLPSCEEKYARRLESLPAIVRGNAGVPAAPLLVAPPAGASPSFVEAYNATAMETFLENSRLPCPFCSRKFDLEQCARHAQACKSNPHVGEDIYSIRLPSVSSPQPPRFFMCHLCGKQYLSSGLRVHLPHCRERWMKEHPGMPLPAEPALRSPADSPVFGLDSGGGSGGGSGGSRAAGMADLNMSLEDYNREASRTFSESSLVACEHCGRTFMPDRLVVHQRSCRPGARARPVTSRAAVSPPAPSSPLPAATAAAAVAVATRMTTAAGDAKLVAPSRSPARPAQSKATEAAAATGSAAPRQKVASSFVQSMSSTCPACTCETVPGAAFCHSCGSRLVQKL